MTASQPVPRRQTPFDNPIARFLAGRFGVWLFLISLGMLFGATLLGFLVIRIQNHDAWPKDLPGLPSLLWVSTLLLMLSSVTMQGAVGAARAQRQRGAPKRSTLCESRPHAVSKHATARPIPIGNS